MPVVLNRVVETDESEESALDYSHTIPFTADNEAAGDSTSTAYAHYRENPSCVDGVVAYVGRDGYRVIESETGCTVAVLWSGRLRAGDTIRGDFCTNGYTYVIDRQGRESKMLVKAYMLSKRESLFHLGDLRVLKEADQQRYDELEPTDTPLF